jgi:hypothetical protein
MCAAGTICLPVSRKALRAAPAEPIAADTLGDRISQFTGDRTECSSSERARWALVLVDRGLAGGSRLTLMKVRRSRSLDNRAVLVNDHLVKLLRFGVATNDVNGRGADEGLRPRVGQPETAHLERRRAPWTRL